MKGECLAIHPPSQYFQLLTPQVFSNPTFEKWQEQTGNSSLTTEDPQGLQPQHPRRRGEAGPGLIQAMLTSSQPKIKGPTSPSKKRSGIMLADKEISPALTTCRVRPFGAYGP